MFYNLPKQHYYPLWTCEGHIFKSHFGPPLHWKYRCVCKAKPRLRVLLMPSPTSVHLLSVYFLLSESLSEYTAVILEGRGLWQNFWGVEFGLLSHMWLSPTSSLLRSQQEPLQCPSFSPRDRFGSNCHSFVSDINISTSFCYRKRKSFLPTRPAATGTKLKGDHAVPSLKVSEWCLSAQDLTFARPWWYSWEQFKGTCYLFCSWFQRFQSIVSRTAL